ncbi:MAG: molybdenum cofactor guanylyltransferase [Weeksellaceae bacterium]|nr:molybdenum cofactor guanylyltransferase [Weeksellaceae bacterium]
MQINQQTKRVGIVLCGGKSTRMGRDKALMQYHGKPHFLHVADLLAEFCGKVVISGSPALYANPQYPVFADLPNIPCQGPAAGFYSIASQHQYADFLLMACDYPLVGHEEIKPLIEQNAPIVAYRNNQGITEALIAYYSAKAAEAVCKRIAAGECSLRHIIDSMTTQYLTDANDSLRSFDTIEDTKNFPII